MDCFTALAMTRRDRGTAFTFFRSPDERSDIRGRRPQNPGYRCIHPGHATRRTPIAGTRAGIYSSHREHHMTNILAFFSTRTLLQIAFILASTVAMKAWSLGLLFGG
jgi:hypothetical protein